MVFRFPVSRSEVSVAKYNDEFRAFDEGREVEIGVRDRSDDMVAETKLNIGLSATVPAQGNITCDICAIV